MKFEHHRQPLAPRHVFVRRLFRFIGYGVIFLGVSLLLGVLGYRYICGLSWVDALLDASMILAGMGPVATISNDAGKYFASAYAIFSGVAFLGTFSIIIAPVLHRIMHRLHLNEGKN